jgi:hypothetical protein
MHKRGAFFGHIVYTDCPALSQEQSTTSSWHFLRQTKLPKGGPETTSVIDNVSKNKTRPALLFFLCLFSGEGGKGSTKAPQAHLSAGTPSIWWLTRRSNSDRVVANLKNRKWTNQGYPTGILNYLRDTRSVPEGTQDRNKDQRRSFTTLEICPRAPTSIVYRPQSQPWLFTTSLRPAYLEILRRGR